MANTEIRFAVADSAGFRSATWKCWSPKGKNDVYLACREVAGAFKTSLHESGRWHTAYFKEFFDQQVRDEHKTPQGRFIDKWSRPAVIAPGVTRAFRIVTPWTSVKTKASTPANVAVASPATPGHAIEFNVILVDAATPVAEWPGKNAQGTQLAGVYVLPNATSVFVVWWEIKMPTLPSFRGAPKYFAGKTADNLASEHLRAMAFGEEPDGSKVIYDLVLDPIAPRR